MRRLFVVPFALACLTCAPKPTTVTLVIEDVFEVRATSADPDIYFSLNWPGDFQVCLEMERTGQKVCQDLAILRAQFSGIQKVKP